MSELLRAAEPSASTAGDSISVAELMAAMPVSALLTDEDGCIVHASQAAHALLGLEGSDLRGAQLDDVLHPLPTDEARRRPGAAVSGRLERGGGVYHVVASPVRGGWLYTLNAESGAASQEPSGGLGESEDTFRNIADNSPIMLWIVDVEGSCTYLSKSWYEFTGQTPAEALGYGWIDALHPADREPTGRLYREAVARREPIRLEYRLRDRDGQYRWSLDFARPRLDESGNFLGYVGMVVDVEFQKQAELALADLALRYRQIAESLPQIVFTATGDGSIDFYNARWFEYTGHRREDATGDSWLESLHPDDRERTLSVWQTCVATGEDYVVECRHRGRDGNYRWFLALAKPIRGSDGIITQWFGTCTDIQDRKETEAEMERRVSQRTHELQAAYRELEGFVYSVAHDLRAPLRAIGATSKILETELHGQISNEHQAMLGRQIVNVAKLARFIEDLLSYARLARQPLTRQPVDFSALAHEVAGAVERAYSSWRTRYEIQPNMTAEGDPAALRTLLENLIENATKYSAEGGTVTVGHSGTAFFVRDDGIGFDMAYHDQIFRPFERLVRDAEYPGTGIGLANVARVVERHGGHIWAESEQGRGSTFWFTLGLP